MGCKAIAQLPYFATHAKLRCRAMPSQGTGHRTFWVRTDRGGYVVRVANRTASRIADEFQVLREVHPLGIAPRPVWVDPTLGISVLEYVQGKTLATSISQAIASKMGATLARLHAFASTQAEPVDWSAYRHDKQFAKAYEATKRFAFEPVLCHNDLNAGNVLCTTNGDIVLLDWEYSGLNDRYFDLASFCVEFDLDAAAQRAFLEAYRLDPPICHDKLRAYTVLYRRVCERWESLTRPLRS